MMRFLFALFMLVSLLPAHARELTEREKLDWHAYHLAIAEAPGDPYTDLLIAKKMPIALRSLEDLGDSDEARVLRARTEVIAARLQARVDASRDADPFMLAADLGCWPETTPATCSERRAKLEKFASDNAYHGMVLMAYAWMAKDPEAYLRAARLAGAAERYDSQPAGGFAGLRDRHRGVPLPETPGQTEQSKRLGPEIMAMGVAAAVAMPPLQHFSAPCRESEGELRDHCLAVAKKMMAQSQSLLEIGIAQSVVEALGNPEEVEAAQAIRREADWLWKRSFPLAAASESVDVAGTDEYFDAYASEGELGAMRALLAVHGIPLTPPDDWTKD